MAYASISVTATLMFTIDGFDDSEESENISTAALLDANDFLASINGEIFELRGTKVQLDIAWDEYEQEFMSNVDNISDGEACSSCGSALNTILPNGKCQDCTDRDS